MTAIIIILALALGTVVGLALGLHIGTTRTKQAMRLGNYRRLINLAHDLVNTPDSLELRPQALKILNDVNQLDPPG